MIAVAGPSRGPGGGRGGFTMVEVLIVLAIVGVLATIAIPNFIRIFGAMRVEEETKRVYVDVVGARSRAVITRRAAFVEFAANRVRTFEDTAPAPDGDGALDAGADRRLAEDNVTHTVDTTGLGGTTLLTFDLDGVADGDGFFRLVSTVNPEYDCVRVEPTRIRVGKYDPTADACNAK